MKQRWAAHRRSLPMRKTPLFLLWIVLGSITGCL
jgi:hypothetical protein